MVCGYTTPQSLITQIQSGLSVSQGAFEYNLTESWRFSKISTTCLGKIFISIPCFRIIGLQENLETTAFVLEQIVTTCFGISDQIPCLVQEFMLENDTQINGTSCRGLYGGPPPSGLCYSTLISWHI